MDHLSRLRGTPDHKKSKIVFNNSSNEYCIEEAYNGEKK